MSEDAISENTRAPVSPEEIARKLLVHNLRNLAAKIKSGLTLTPAELATLRATANKPAGGEEGYAKNWVELAAALGVDRRTMQNWRDRFDDYPRPRADGRHDIAAWRAWARAKRLRVSEGDETELRMRNLALHNLKLETQINILRKSFVARDQVERVGASLGMAIRKAVSMVHLNAPDFVGLSLEEADRRLRELEDDIIAQLNHLDEQLDTLSETTPEEAGDLVRELNEDDSEPDFREPPEKEQREAETEPPSADEH